MKAPVRHLFVATATVSTLVCASPDLARQTETNPIVFRPLDRVIQNNIIKKRDGLGNLCYYDTARRNEKDYYGLSVASLTKSPSKGSTPTPILATILAVEMAATHVK